jgi:ankyrin repeat protein
LKNFFNSVARLFKSDPDEIGDHGYTRLQRAIVENDDEKVRACLKAGADINFRGSLIFPPLHFALEKDRHQIVITLLAAGADVNLQAANGQTPLHIAAAEGQETFVHALLRQGADPNIKDNIGQTPLHKTAVAKPEIIDALLRFKARVSEQDAEGNTPLHLFLGKVAMVERLLEGGADPNVKNRDGISPYMMMLEEKRLQQYPAVLQRMLTCRADLGSTNRLGETILHLAARLEMPDTFDKLLDSSELRVKDAGGNNVLHALVRTQNVLMIRNILDRAPELLHEANDGGRTPLAELAGRCTPQNRIDDKFMATAIIMIERGADPSSADERGVSLLHHAVAQGKTDFADYLLRKKANPDARDKSGRAPLHVAVIEKNVVLLDRLLDSGADPDLTDKLGWTVLDRLAERGDRESPVVQRLIVAGGQYKKQLPLHPELMRQKRVTIDKGAPSKDKPKDGAYTPGFKP